MKIFFYGLFMDEDILRNKGIHISDQQTGFLKDHTIKITERANLVSSMGDKVFGSVMEISEDDVKQLYSQPDVSEYFPEEFSIVTDTGETVTATCYILPHTDGTLMNQAYAKALYELAERKKFPAAYLERLKAMAIKGSK